MIRNRVDVHKPTEMVSSDYRFLAASYATVDFDDEGNQIKGIEWDGTEEWSSMGQPIHSTCAHAIIGQCDHCGAHHTYQTILLYIPTGELLSVGRTCGSERFGRSEWKNVVADGARRAELRNRREANERKALAVMDAETLTAFAWAKTPEAHAIAKDMVKKAQEWGPLSPKQMAFLCKLYAESIKKAEEIETGVIVPCPEGRVQITGTIKSVNFYENDFGGSYKMLVVDDSGFRVFGTCPRSLVCERGERVTFSANVTPKQGEIGFGFYSRPTKAANLETEAVAA